MANMHVFEDACPNFVCFWLERRRDLHLEPGASLRQCLKPNVGVVPRDLSRVLGWLVIMWVTKSIVKGVKSMALRNVGCDELFREIVKFHRALFLL